MEQNQYIDKIENFLTRLLTAHGALAEVVELERSVLTAAELEPIEKVVHRKQELIDEIKRIEHERRESLRAVDQAKNLDDRDQPMSYWLAEIARVAPERGRTIHNLFKTLVLTIERIEEQNRDNLEFVEKSLSHIERMKANILGERVPQTETYGRKGKKSAQGTNSPAFVSREA